MIVASIDIGTNTVLLLIAKVSQESGTLIPLLNEYRMPRIGQGLKQTGIINPDKLILLYDILKEYKSIIKKYKCEKVIVIGTNALRIAENTPEISDTIEKHLKLELEVISGDTEAEYAYLGAISSIEKPTNSLVIDIGGGSTELIFGYESKIMLKKSLPIGSVSATEQFLRHSPPLSTEIKELKKEIARIFSEFRNTAVPDNVIAVAGTATTLGCMNLNLKEFKEEKVEKSSISIDEMKRLINKLNLLTSKEILERYGPVMKGREDIILGGAIILSEIMHLLGLNKLIVSSRGIRYGAVYKSLIKSVKNLHSE